MGVVTSLQLYAAVNRHTANGGENAENGVVWGS